MITDDDGFIKVSIIQKFGEKHSELEDCFEMWNKLQTI